MELQYLGTAASEGWPAMFCDCPSCRKARELGGRNLRTRSQSLLDGRILIDFPADTYWHCIQFGVQLDKIEQLFITHSHCDHFFPQDLLNKMPPYAASEAKPLNVYGNEAVISGLLEQLRPEFGEERWKPFLLLHTLHPFEAVNAGGYTVTPLPCDHMASEQALNFLFEKDGKRLLYAHDTGFPLPETLAFLKGKYLNAVSLDCTFVLKDCRHGHMGFPQDLETRRALTENGCADGRTVFIANHFSHNGGAVYDEMTEQTKDTGFVVSYDGMTIRF